MSDQTQIVTQIEGLSLDEVMELQERVKAIARNKAIEELEARENDLNKLRAMVGLKKRPMKGIPAKAEAEDEKPSQPAKGARKRGPKKKAEQPAEASQEEQQEA